MKDAAEEFSFSYKIMSGTFFLVPACTFAVEDEAVRAADLLSGSGILSTSASTLRSLSSEIRRDSRGSSPDILYLGHERDKEAVIFNFSLSNICNFVQTTKKRNVFANN